VTSFKNLLNTIVLKFIPGLGIVYKRSNESPRSVVLINWDNLGDFILFSSVIREVRNNYPSAKLLVVAQRENQEAVAHCTYVDQWIFIKGHKKARKGQGHGKEISYARKLIVTYFLLLVHGRGKVDLLFGPDWLLVKDWKQFTSNLIFKKGNLNYEFLRNLSQVNSLKYINHAHQVPRMLSVIDMFGLKVFDDSIESWFLSYDVASIELHNKKTLNQSKKILVSLGAGQLRRNWPVENIAALIDTLVKKFPEVKLTLVGPPSMNVRQIKSLFKDSQNLTNLVGKTKLKDVALLMKDSDLLISNDSGLVHIAASLKLACVVVSAHAKNADPWHLHSPNRYHPWKTAYSVVQPDFLLDDCTGSCQAEVPHCIKSVSVSEVFGACQAHIVNN